MKRTFTSPWAAGKLLLSGFPAWLFLLFGCTELLALYAPQTPWLVAGIHTLLAVTALFYFYWILQDRFELKSMLLLALGLTLLPPLLSFGMDKLITIRPFVVVDSIRWIGAGIAMLCSLGLGIGLLAKRKRVDA